jgi:hypothetical protein
MTNGVERRSAIDTETVRGLLLINGGGAVALLAFLASVFQQPELRDLARAIVYAVFIMQIGMACAVVHNRLRRVCSLEYSRAKLRRCVLFGRELREPCVCHWSIALMWASILAFLAGGIVVLIAALRVISS